MAPLQSNLLAVTNLFLRWRRKSFIRAGSPCRGGCFLAMTLSLRAVARSGLVAEWLRRGLQILAPRFDSGRGLHNSPDRFSMFRRMADFSFGAGAACFRQSLFLLSPICNRIFNNFCKKCVFSIDASGDFPAISAQMVSALIGLSLLSQCARLSIADMDFARDDHSFDQGSGWRGDGQR